MVYVDELLPCIKSNKWPFPSSCHLIADSKAELYLFAQKIDTEEKLDTRWKNASF